MDLSNPDVTTQFKELVDRALSRVNTSIPGVIESFDATTQTCSVIPAIQMRVNLGSNDRYVDLPVITNAPIIFPFASTAGFAITLPIRKGDPCLILFSQRAIDNWHDKGGIQPPEDSVSSRHHDLTDAIVLFAPSPIPNTLGEWETDGISIRNTANTTRITVYDDNILLESPTKITLDTPLTKFTGNVEVDGGIRALGTYGDWGGNVEAAGDVIAQSDVSLHNHTHPGDSGGTTGPPNNIP